VVLGETLEATGVDEVVEECWDDVVVGKDDMEVEEWEEDEEGERAEEGAVVTGVAAVEVVGVGAVEMARDVVVGMALVVK
jgi:hypothetical protein